MSTTDVVRKRIVLRHTTGLRAGLHEIVGLLEGTAEQVAGALQPSFQYGQPPCTVQHAKTTPRYIEYREWAQAPTGQLNDFNPSQV